MRLRSLRVIGGEPTASPNEASAPRRRLARRRRIAVVQQVMRQ
jgi:hypothetical protein